jgi:hypothetical protein
MEDSMKRKDDSLAKVAAMMWGELQKLPAGAKLTISAQHDTDPNNTSGALFVFEARLGDKRHAMGATLRELGDDADRGLNTNAIFRSAINTLRSEIGWPVTKQVAVTKLSQNSEASENPSK